MYYGENFYIFGSKDENKLDAIYSSVALMLSLNRKIPRATWRTRDGNFSLHGLLGFDMYEICTG